MLRFFRHIRQRLLTDNKFSKYLLYAVGEILLVVIGILIALQVDSWNEERKTKQRLDDFLVEIQQDLSDDILKANDIIDGFIDKDSMFRHIKLNQVSLSADRFYERQRPLRIIYEFENFRLQSKGYEGLVQNIDNIPKKYEKLKGQLNYIYVTNRYDMESYNERVKENAYKNIDYLKNKTWSGDFWEARFDDEMIDYFQSDLYKNDAIHYFNDLGKFIVHVFRFKIEAIECYQEIARLLSDNSSFPEHISYTFPKTEGLSHLAGEYLLVSGETPTSEIADSMEFVVVEDLFNWHYMYEGVSYINEFNIPLYWHRDQIFFNTLAPGIWEFKIENTSKVLLKTRLFGAYDHYEKIMPTD